MFNPDPAYISPALTSTGGPDTDSSEELSNLKLTDTRSEIIVAVVVIVALLTLYAVVILLLPSRIHTAPRELRIEDGYEDVWMEALEDARRDPSVDTLPLYEPLAINRKGNIDEIHCLHGENPPQYDDDGEARAPTRQGRERYHSESEWIQQPLTGSQ